MADQSGTDVAAMGTSGAPDIPDYALADALELETAEQYRALFEDTRAAIVSVLLERAATTSELAAALERPKGTIGHHLKVLEEAGLVHVVRTKRVRALEARYYGRTARVFLYHREHDAVGQEQRVLARAAAEMSSLPPGAEPQAYVRYARIPAERAEEWHRRLDDLVVEFAGQPAGGDVTYALVYGLYPTGRRPLASSAETSDEASDETSDGAAPEGGRGA